MSAWWRPRSRAAGARSCARPPDRSAMKAAREVGTELGYGIGVHTGDAMVGNLGSDQYQNFTAIGDTVNVAARLQAQAKAGEVICSAAVLSAAGDGVTAASLGALELKGRK